MQGENWSFRKDTLAYLRAHDMVMNPNFAASWANPVGVYDFDISPVGPCMGIRFAADRPNAGTWRTHLIRAHWLPWNNVGTTVCQIDDRADYFFTVDLSGCRVTVTPGPYRLIGTNYPTVRHIGGGLTLANRNLATNNAVNALPVGQQHRARSVSQASGIQYNVQALCVGFKTALGVWVFYVLDDDPVTGARRVRRFYP